MCPRSCQHRSRGNLSWHRALAMILGFSLWSLGCSTYFGIYHQVQSGENLYRIAKAYDYPYQELAEINDLEDPTQIRPGDRVFIPGVRERRRVPKPPGYKPDKTSVADSSARRSGDRGTGSPSSRNGARNSRRIEIAESPSVATFRGQFIWPVDGRLTSRYGFRDGNMHDGVDVGAAKGSPVRAAAAGRVIYSDDGIRGYGNLIIIKHEGVFSSVYAHNSVNYVKRNDFVKKGELVARVGATGRASGPHLHFEIRKGRKAVNPLFYLPKTEASR